MTKPQDDERRSDKATVVTPDFDARAATFLTRYGKGGGDWVSREAPILGSLLREMWERGHTDGSVEIHAENSKLRTEIRTMKSQRTSEATHTIMVGGFAPGNETPNNRAVQIPRTEGKEETHGSVEHLDSRNGLPPQQQEPDGREPHGGEVRPGSEGSGPSGDGRDDYARRRGQPPRHHGGGGSEDLGQVGNEGNAPGAVGPEPRSADAPKYTEEDLSMASLDGRFEIIEALCRHLRDTGRDDIAAPLWEKFRPSAEDERRRDAQRRERATAPLAPDHPKAPRGGK